MALSIKLWVYSKPHKVGNRIKAKKCWDSLYSTLKDPGYWVSNFWASTVYTTKLQGLQALEWFMECTDFTDCGFTGFCLDGFGCSMQDAKCEEALQAKP